MDLAPEGEADYCLLVVGSRYLKESSGASMVVRMVSIACVTGGRGGLEVLGANLNGDTVENAVKTSTAEPEGNIIDMPRP